MCVYSTNPGLHMEEPNIGVCAFNGYYSRYMTAWAIYPVCSVHFEPFSVVSLTTSRHSYSPPNNVMALMGFLLVPLASATQDL